MSISLKLDGFENLLEKLQSAGKSVDKEALSCIQKSAKIAENELKTQMQKSGVPASLINSMPQSEIKASGNRFTAKVGYKKGAYNPNDLSDGYKVVFLNYGTPHRSKHGKVPAKGFIQKAKRSAKALIKKSQKQMLDNIIKEAK